MLSIIAKVPQADLLQLRLPIVNLHYELGQGTSCIDSHSIGSIDFKSQKIAAVRCELCQNLLVKLFDRVAGDEFELLQRSSTANVAVTHL